ncbi:hypothetical protein OPT61_g6394 [Boeremia exigua]|uniref:Uncharacterized protein n=1 Tax=Boeremia exigua TaxID=749465 RepID=A0ACC2I6S9_9PLEO|nr:hypothetical protein OPT61_g6394 [Boeremia exigua]
MDSSPTIPHPSDLARVLLSIGQIVQGSLQSVSLQGGCCCSWIAAWGDFVLGLRVLVRDEDDNVVFANFNPAEAFAQINVTFVMSTLNDDMICVQTSHLVRSGVDFVRHCFGRQRFIHQHDVTFHAGTLTWSTLFLGSFGSAFGLLTGDESDDSAERPDSSISKLLEPDIQVWDRALLSRQEIFSRLIAISIIVLFAKSPTISYYDHAQHYLSRVCDIVQELQPFRNKIQTAIEEFSALYAAAATKPALIGAGVERNVFERVYELEQVNPAAFVRHLARHTDENNGSLFGDLAALFAGQDWGVDLLGSIARSDGKLYCYSRVLEELTDNLRAATQVHVGSGTMEYRSRTYRVLFDRSGQKEREPGYPARHTEIVQSTECLQYDTTSRPITSEVIIDETPSHLYLRHQISTNSGQFLIAPTLFLERLLGAVAYRCNERIPL